MDKTKFLERPGDSEGFSELQLANAHVDGLPVYADPAFRYNDKTMSYHRIANPKGWQEVDGTQLPPVTWADYSDDELEYQFQQWLKTSTQPENVDAYRARLRQRIEEMVAKAVTQ